MDLSFVTECRFYKTKDSKYYTDDMSFSNKLWERYLKSFKRVYVIARVFDTEESFDEAFLVSNVTLCPIYPFESVLGFMKNFNTIRNQLRLYLREERVNIFRGPGTLGTLAAEICIAKKQQFGFEVVGDPDDIFSPGVIMHPLRPFLRMFYVNFLKRQAKQADSILYVTKFTLQNKYPAAEKTCTEYASNVFLDKGRLATMPKTLSPKKEYNLISIGSLNQMYKSPEIVLKAISKLGKNGIKCNLTWLGNGRFLNDMKLLAKTLGIENQVFFIGAVSSEEVTKELEKSDIFVLASRTEGLPRAMVEAMAMGLPCIGTMVGGIPELLDVEVLIETENADALAAKVQFMLENLSFTNDQAAKNLENAKEYSSERLDERRTRFYDSLKRIHVNT